MYVKMKIRDTTSNGFLGNVNAGGTVTCKPFNSKST